MQPSFSPLDYVKQAMLVDAGAAWMDEMPFNTAWSDLQQMKYELLLEGYTTAWVWWQIRFPC